MQFGVHLFPTQTSIQPEALARAAEERGLDSVWFSEHTHIPLGYLNSHENLASPLPDYYWQTYDLFVAMTLAAAATQRIKVGSGVALVIERDPIFLAKEIATVDQISKGRFLFGAGAGWLEPEMANHGVVYRTRFQRFKEQIRAIKEIWAEDEPEFHGRFVNFDRMKAYPKPYQRPHPPIIMGGEGPKAIECAAELCDGWAPWGMEWTQAKAAIAVLRKQTAAQGRDPEAMEISLFEKSLPEAAVLAEMEALGVRRIILTVLGQSRDEALPRLDELAKMYR